MKIEHFIAGRPQPPSKKKYRDCAQRIRNIVSRYNNDWLQDDQEDVLINYLKGLAHNYDFWDYIFCILILFSIVYL